MIGQQEEIVASIEEIRPGRHLFIRKVRIGNTNSNSTSTDDKSNNKQNEVESNNNDNTNTIFLQLLFVHGICGSEAQFHSVIQCIQDKLSTDTTSTTTTKNIEITCILYDSIGCGQSPILDNNWDAYSKDELIYDLKEIIKTYINIQIPTILIGHSYGPSIILGLLRHYNNDNEITTSTTTNENNDNNTTTKTTTVIPFNLLGCVFLCTTINSSKYPMHDGGSIIFNLPLFILNIIQPLLTNMFISNGIHPIHTELCTIVKNASNTNNMYIAKAYYKHIQWATIDDLTILNDLQIPILLLHGSTDKIILEPWGKYLSTLLEKSSHYVVITDARHLVMMEQPKQVATEFVLFFQKLLLSI